MKSIKVGLFGIGTVGSGVFEVLKRNADEISRRAGRKIELTMVADLDTDRAKKIVGNDVQVVNDARAIIANPDIDVVVELIGGYGIAKALVLEAIAAGKHVVTANKALLAVHGSEIFAAAKAKGVMVAFEASVAGGIPIIKALREGLSANRIEWVAGQDIKYAEQLGYRIKLLGITKRVDKGVELRVHPTLVPAKRLIASVEGAMNAVMVQADAVGTTLYYGKGAGSEPTASAVIADLVDIARTADADAVHRVPYLAFHGDAPQDLCVVAMDEVVTSYYLRLRVADQTGVLAQVTGILAQAGISIDAVLQREADDVCAETDKPQTDVIILTHDTREGAMNDALAQMQALSTVLEPIVRIRKEDLA